MGGKSDRCGEPAWPLAPVRLARAAVRPRLQAGPGCLGMGVHPFPSVTPCGSLAAQQGQRGQRGQRGQWVVVAGAG